VVAAAAVIVTKQFEQTSVGAVRAGNDDQQRSGHGEGLHSDISSKFGRDQREELLV
jgi:hypothetical protein